MLGELGSRNSARLMMSAAGLGDDVSCRCFHGMFSSHVFMAHVSRPRLFRPARGSGSSGIAVALHRRATRFHHILRFSHVLERRSAVRGSGCRPDSSVGQGNVRVQHTVAWQSRSVAWLETYGTAQSIASPLGLILNIIPPWHATDSCAPLASIRTSHANRPRRQPALKPAQRAQALPPSPAIPSRGWSARS